jgi:hypothetical protein
MGPTGFNNLYTAPPRYGASHAVLRKPEGNPTENVVANANRVIGYKLMTH